MSFEDMSIVVFTPMNYQARLTFAFKEASEESSQQVTVKFVSSIDDLNEIRATDIHVDFVCVIVDTKDSNSFASLKTDLSKISSDFVATRLLVINGSCRSGLLQAAKDLVSLVDDYRIPIMNAELEDNSSLQLTAEKVIKLAGLASGFRFGHPIAIPTVDEIIL